MTATKHYATHLGPHSIEAEEATLGAILINAEIVLPQIVDLLKPDDFFEIKHQWVYEAMLAVHARQEMVDYLTVSQEVRNRGKIDEIGGVSYLTYLLNSTPTHLYAEAYALLVRRAAVRRRLIGAAAQIAQLARDDSGDLSEVITKCEATLLGVTQTSVRTGALRVGEVATEYLSILEDRYQNPERTFGLPTGFAHLDRVLGGLEPGELSVIAARPGVGKTSWLLSVARNVARLASTPIHMFSLEMAQAQLIRRLFALESGLDSQKFRDGSVSPAEWDSIFTAMSRIDTLPLWIDTTAGLTVSQIRARARQMKREYGTGMILVDYLQLVKSPADKGNGNRTAEVGSVARELKEMARELHVHVMAAAQLNRSTETRVDRTPILSDLRESGEIEQTAGIVMFLHPAKDMTGKTDLIVAKNRDGQTATLDFWFNRNTTNYMEVRR